MKKIFSFVIVAAAVAMVSCAGNSNKGAAEAVETVEATEVVAVEACDSASCDAACAEKCDSVVAEKAEACCKE